MFHLQHLLFRIATMVSGCLLLAGASMATEPNPQGKDQAMPETTMPDMQMPSPHQESMEVDQDMMQMHAMYGSYPMNREASGTSWQPDNTPVDEIDFMLDGWMGMAHGYLDAVTDHQGGSRGHNMLYSPSMLMLMAEHPLGPGIFGLHGMFSLDPLMGPRGYPLLFASGETADGRTPLIDRQHPHDLFMELAASYSVPLGDQRSVFGYLGLPGEPALGPPAFMHRFSGEDIPEAPISHHWLDSTHIAEGVATAGLIFGPVKLEASSFNGREPDQFRYNIETRAFDSSSARITYNPTEELSLQLSQGFLKSPEQLEPEISDERRTASAIYQTSIDSMPFGTTLAWGENRRSTGIHSVALLLESTLKAGAYTLFGRLEHVDNDELFDASSPLAGTVFKVSKLSLGAIDDFYQAHHLTFGVGGLVSRYQHDAVLDPFYGKPTSAMIFLRAKIEP
jgi:hypothetical protein